MIRRSPGSYYWDQEQRRGSPFRGCLRIRGGVVWSCPHEHDTAPEARACASEHLKAHPNVGLNR